MINITKTYQLFLLKQEIPWLFNVERTVSNGKKREDGENLFFKALPNRFWLTSKSCLWFNKVVHRRHSNQMDFVKR